MDLLEHLSAIDTSTEITHSVLPCMAIACGLDLLEALRSGVRTVLGTRSNRDPYRVVTCPACLAAFGGLDGLRAEISRAQGRQAPA